jgi:hypothetical protein
MHERRRPSLKHSNRYSRDEAALLSIDSEDSPGQGTFTIRAQFDAYFNEQTIPFKAVSLQADTWSVLQRERR